MNESKSYVTFNVSILGDVPIQRINVGVMFSTEDGTAHGKCTSEESCGVCGLRY